MRGFFRRLAEIRQYPSAIVGLILIASLFSIGIYALFSMSYSEVISLWRGGESVWIENPRNAMPVWYNLRPGVNLPVTIIRDSKEAPATKNVHLADGIKEIRISLPIEFTYDDFPKELSLFFDARFDQLRPFVSMQWHTPDGRVIALGDQQVGTGDTYRISQDQRLQRRIGGRVPEVGLFADPEANDTAVPLKGVYTLEIEALLFEDDADLDARLVSYGQLHGLAGTDHRRRDITIALLYGTPLAISFGVLAAVGSTLSTFIIAAIGVWWGGWVDAAIQRITEVNLILPVLPILIMIGTMYSRSIWVMLAFVIILGIFSGGIKTYRAIFLQIKESPYIDAARAYGASNLRIVFRYMLPRAAPLLVPQFITIIPGFVFLEATLALLGLGDPVLPTWGKVLRDAYDAGALYRGYFYWVMGPSVLLITSGLGFSMLGFSLDRIFNPRLRGL